MTATGKPIKTVTRGFTLLELLLVLTIIGILLTLVLPRFRRVADNARFAQVRQSGTEIANFINQWVTGQGRLQGAHRSLTPVDFLCREIPDPDAAGFTANHSGDREDAWLISHPLHHRYTGDDNYDAVEKLISPDDLPRNPFNQISYFAPANDDPDWRPSPNPGLLYLTSFRERPIRPAPREQYREAGERAFRFFYLIYTGIPAGERREGRNARWYGGMDDELEPGIRRGIFVCRHPDRIEPYAYPLETATREPREQNAQGSQKRHRRQ